LFLLVVEGLSISLLNAKRTRPFKRIKEGRSLNLSSPTVCGCYSNFFVMVLEGMQTSLGRFFMYIIYPFVCKLYVGRPLISFMRISEENKNLFAQLLPFSLGRATV
jgi:hypothetical protein